MTESMDHDLRCLLAAPSHCQEVTLPTPQSRVHYSELPRDPSDTPAARDWNHYLREVKRLLAEGHEGRWVLIHSETIVGIWESEEETRRIATERYLMEPVLIHQIREHEPLMRPPTFLLRCHN